MLKFLSKIFIFFTVGGLIFVCGLMLPATPKASNYYLFSKIDKDILLKETPSKRIIFIGGSNLVYGLNSALIKDSLSINPINAGLSATVGLELMMDNTLRYVKPGDIVVISPEYQQFNGKFAHGGQGLVRLLLDIDHTGISDLSVKQWINFATKTPEFFVSKLNPREYFNYSLKPEYGIDIFNEYGDSSFHWELEQEDFATSDFTRRKLNRSIITKMQNFQVKLKNKEVRLFLTFPGFQESSFELNRKQILEVEEELKNKNFEILGTAERYKMPDSLMFDTPYHLTKKGVDYRTLLLIEDLKKQL